MARQHLKEFAFYTVQKEEVREFYRDFSTMTGQREGFSNCKEHWGVALGLVHSGQSQLVCSLPVLLTRLGFGEL